MKNRKHDKRRERSVESYLSKKIHKLGGQCYKWRAMDNIGIPDRLCMTPWMGIFLVEVKKLNGSTSRMQEFTFGRIKEAGGVVFVVYGHEGVDKLVDYLLDLKGKFQP